MTQPPKPRAERQIEICQELIEIGLHLARLLAQRSQAETTGDPPRHRRPDPMLLFNSLSRSIRLIIDLETSLAATPSLATPSLATRAPTRPAPRPVSLPSTEAGAQTLFDTLRDELGLFPRKAPPTKRQLLQTTIGHRAIGGRDGAAVP